MADKIPLTSLNAREIADALEVISDDILPRGGAARTFHAKQIFEWIYRGAEDFDCMTNLSAPLRRALSGKALLRTTKVTRTIPSEDDAAKLQITLGDGCAVEAVLLSDKTGRKTACVSSQAGCPAHCAFCRTGRLGFKRNLNAGEIVEQFLHLERLAGKIDNIVFMGMGEPCLNLESVRKSIQLLTDKGGRNLSIRRITLSTSGIVKGIYDLADNGPHVRLAFSLPSADEETRKRLMPVALSNPLGEIQKALRYYIDKTGNRVTLETVLLRNVNTSPEDAERLARFVKSLNANVNLIPWNKVDGLGFEEPDARECAAFAKVLRERGVNVTVRRRRGSGIAAACGQLGGG